MAVKTDPDLFGSELKRWRNHRRYSQEELAHRAEVSQRHVSFLENGRTRPSAEMVEHLAVTLDVPLRARNGLLSAAGFAPAYSEGSLDGESLQPIRWALETLVKAHDPFPAYVVDRRWELVLANNAAAALTVLLADTDAALELGGNILRFFLHPDGVRDAVPNWEQAAAALMRRLRRECDENPADTEMRALLDEVSRYEGVADLGPEPASSAGSDLVMELQFRIDGKTLRFYTTLMVLADAADVTLAELRLETLLPADTATAEALRRLVD
jgi:transcriptional regulator with XRE-family HTH domain